MERQVGNRGTKTGRTDKFGKKENGIVAYRRGHEKRTSVENGEEIHY